MIDLWKKKKNFHFWASMNYFFEKKIEDTISNLGYWKWVLFWRQYFETTMKPTFMDLFEAKISFFGDLKEHKFTVETVLL